MQETNELKKLLSKNKSEPEFLENTQSIHITNTQKVCSEELHYHLIKSLWPYKSRNAAGLN